MTASTATVYLTIGTNPADPDGVLGGTTSKAATAGVASFGDLEIDRTGTGYTLVASDVTGTPDGTTGLDDETSSTFMSDSTVKVEVFTDPAPLRRQPAQTGLRFGLQLPRHGWDGNRDAALRDVAQAAEAAAAL